MNDDILDRRGRFVLEESQTVGNLPFWGQVMSKMLVIRCEHQFFSMSFEYCACSPLFRKAEEGEVLPLYKIQTNEYNDIEAIEI